MSSEQALGDVNAHRIAIDHDKRCALSKVISEARAEKGWSMARTAIEATAALRAEARRKDARATRMERLLWSHLEINDRSVKALENHPKAPLGSPAKRARLLGVTLALGLDRGLVNRLAGGV